MKFPPYKSEVSTPAVLCQPNRQLELLPEARAKDSMVVCEPLPNQTRIFGKLVDTSHLKPGDLLLTREVSPGRICRWIETVQYRGGYDKRDSRWTHAGMYAGHGKIIEATLEGFFGGRVRSTNLWDCSQGGEALRFRRPKRLVSEDDRNGILVHACERMNRRYDFCKVCWGVTRVLLLGHRFFEDGGRSRRRPSITCAGLYSDAYSKVTRRILAPENGVCTPALLSASEEFEDIDVNWLSIV